MSLRSYLIAQKHPVIFPLPSKWPCSNFTYEQWGDVLPDLYEFRHEPLGKCPHFEVQHTERFSATIKEFGVAVRTGNFEKASVNLKERWVYSAYNWVSAGPVKRKDWLDWSFFEGSDKDYLHTTIWIGSRGAFTPCHRDSYGLNLSCQLIGSKEWILFPPSDSKYLYETRLPFEESTIFSSIDFNRTPIDLSKWPLLKNATPYRVTVKPGEVLLIPKHWWHFVRCMDEGNINVNRWFDVESDSGDKIDEALATLLVERIHDLADGQVPTFNGARPVHDVKIIFEAIRRSLEKMNADSATAEHNYAQSQDKSRWPDSSDDADSTPPSSETEEDVVVKNYSISRVERCPLEDFTTPGVVTPASARAHVLGTRGNLTPNDVFRSILDSEVLALVRKKLNEKYCQ